MKLNIDIDKLLKDLKIMLPVFNFNGIQIGLEELTYPSQITKELIGYFNFQVEDRCKTSEECFKFLAHYDPYLKHTQQKIVENYIDYPGTNLWDIQTSTKEILNKHINNKLLDIYFIPEIYIKKESNG